MIVNIKKLSLLLLISVSVTKANKCGKGYGTCPDDECCSRYGWCGTTDEYCGYKCQTEFGRCNIEFNTGNKKGKNIVNMNSSSVESLCEDSKLSKKIIIYYPEWKYFDYPPEEIPFNKITHVNYAFAEINKNDFSLEYDSSKFLELIETAHDKNPDIKVLLSIGGWTGSKYYSKMTSSSSNRSKFVKSVKRMLEASDADGIDIDWEYPGTEGAYDDNFDEENDTKNLLKLLKELREEIGYSKIISAAVPFNTFEIDYKPLQDMTEYAELFDYVNIMAYDFAGSWSPVTTHQSSLYPTKGDGKGYSLSGAVENWRNANFPSRKIVVGIPAYGRSWISGSSTNYGFLQKPSDTHPKGDEEDFVDSDTKRYSSTWKYKNLRKDILKYDFKESTGNWIRVWDKKASAPFLFNKSTKQFITYDDPNSVSIKADYVIDHGLGGMMMWEIEEDTNNCELITTMYEKFISLTCNKVDFTKNNAKYMVGGLNIDIDSSSTTTRTTTRTTTTTTKKKTTVIKTISNTSRFSGYPVAISDPNNINSNGSCPNQSQYKCCHTCVVAYEDTNKWGLMNNEWCSLTYECLERIKVCWAEAFGYPCCSQCTTVLDESNNRKWGIENNRWCGIPSYC